VTDTSEKTPFWEKMMSSGGDGRILDEKPQVFKEQQNKLKRDALTSDNESKTNELGTKYGGQGSPIRPGGPQVQAGFRQKHPPTPGS
jgi:hypothetical protein